MKVLTLALVALFAIGCNKKSNDSTAVADPLTTYTLSNGLCNTNLGTNVNLNYCLNTSTGYTYNGGICYDRNGISVSSSNCSSSGFSLSGGSCYSSTGQIVDSTYCASSGSYYLQNGSCYSSAGQAVNAIYCSSASTSAAQQCYGAFYYQSYYGLQPVLCSGGNCTGYVLYNGQSQMVYCP